MRVLVTGALGFLGQHTCEFLHRDGVTVVGTDLAADARDADAGDRVLLDSPDEYFGADLSEPDWSGSCSEVDAVVHTAGLSRPWGKPEAFHRANVVASQRVAEFCVKRGIPLVHISSPAIYAHGANALDLLESTPVKKDHGTNGYSRSKAEAEALLQRMRTEQGLRVVTLRPGAIVGLGDQATAPRVVQALKRGWFPLVAGGRALRDFTSVENVAHAIVLSLKHFDGAEGRAYNITNGVAVSIQDALTLFCKELHLSPRRVHVPAWVAWTLAAVLEPIGRLIGWEPLITRFAVRRLVYSRTLSIEAAKRDLDYQPSVSLEQSVERYCLGTTI